MTIDYLGIRKQANFNNDVMLVGKVDSFINENFPQVVDESVEFTQLPCIKVCFVLDWLRSLPSAWNCDVNANK